MRNGCLPKILIGLGLCLSLVANAIELEYISPDAKNKLALEFDQAVFSAKDADAIKQKKWNCDMYGVRTRLQVKHDMPLYRWDNKESWHNDGAQVVNDYVEDAGSLRGKNARFQDQIKLNAKGQLLSRLSLNQPEGEAQVVAYSVCDPH